VADLANPGREEQERHKDERAFGPVLKRRARLCLFWLCWEMSFGATCSGCHWPWPKD